MNIFHHHFGLRIFSTVLSVVWIPLLLFPFHFALILYSGIAPGHQVNSSDHEMEIKAGGGGKENVIMQILIFLDKNLDIPFRIICSYVAY